MFCCLSLLKHEHKDTPIQPEIKSHAINYFIAILLKINMQLMTVMRGVSRLNEIRHAFLSLHGDIELLETSRKSDRYYKFLK